MEMTCVVFYVNYRLVIGLTKLEESNSMYLFEELDMIYYKDSTSVR